MKRIKVALPFYITNSCNYNCDGCYTLSNYNASGHQLWEDYQHIYKQWSTKLDVVDWQLYGGEPTLNPTYLEWIKGLFEIWPNSIGRLRTNGSTITPKNQKLYDFVKNVNGNLLIEIVSHNILNLDTVLSNVRQWLTSPYIEIPYPALSDVPNMLDTWQNSYQAIKGDSWPDCNTPDEWHSLPLAIRQECLDFYKFSPELFADKLLGRKFTDANNVVVIVEKGNFFSNGPLIPNTNLKDFSLHQSDPIKAHDICHNKMCTEFHNGKIYKCNTVGHFPDFDDQFNLLLSDDDRKLLHSYEPATVDMSVEELTLFIDNLKNPIPQCKFCPENKIITEIFADTKKIFFQKKTKK